MIPPWLAELLLVGFLGSMLVIAATVPPTISDRNRMRRRRGRS